MKVKVYAPYFGDTQVLDKAGYLELDDDASLRDVFKKLKIPFYSITSMLCAVNYESVKKSTKLSDGDIVSFVSPISGGS